MRNRGLSKVAIDHTVEQYRYHLEALIREFNMQVMRCIDDTGFNIPFFYRERNPALYPTATCLDLVQFVTRVVDPSPKGIYTKWLVKMIAKGDDIGVGFFAMAGTNHEFTLTLARYDDLKPCFPERYRDINAFRSLGDLIDFVKEFDHFDHASVRQHDREQRERLIAVGEAVELHRTERYVLMRIKSPTAARYFGRATKWCIMIDDPDSWGTYEKMPLYFILLRGDGERYALAMDISAGFPVVAECRNSTNVNTSIGVIQDMAHGALQIMAADAEKECEQATRVWPEMVVRKEGMFEVKWTVVI